MILTRNSLHALYTTLAIACLIPTDAVAAPGDFVRHLPGPGVGYDTGFGRSISVFGDDLLITAPAYLEFGTWGAACLVRGDFLTSQGCIHGPTDSDRFGWSSDMDSNLLLFGDLRNHTGGFNSGSVHVFSQPSREFTTTITNPFPAENDNFGVSVALFGDKFIVGASGDDTVATNVGAAYVFDTASGDRLHTLLPPTSPSTASAFGLTIRGNDREAFIGASLGADGGSIYIYDVDTGSYLRTLHPPMIDADSLFGSSVAFSNDGVLVGAPGAPGGGKVFLMDSHTNEVLQTYLNPSPDEGDGFGASISVFGSKVIVGAPGDDSRSLDDGGAYLFDIVSGNLELTLVNPWPSTDENGISYHHRFGQSVTGFNSLALIGVKGSSFYEDSSLLVFDASSDVTPGDINLDGQVDRTDVALFVREFGRSLGGTWDSGDFDGDGKTTLKDLALLQQHISVSSSSRSFEVPVPEPSQFVLIAAAFFSFLLYNRRPGVLVT